MINLSPIKRLILIFFGMLILNFISDKIILNFLYFETLNKTFYLNKYNYLFTFFCIFLLLNTFNMTDGINGLALNIFVIWFLFPPSLCLKNFDALKQFVSLIKS